MSKRPSSPFILTNTAMLWASTAIAAVALWPIYLSSQIIVVVAVTVFVGSAIAILGAMFRWNSLIVLLATVAAFLAFGVPLAVPSKAQFGVLPTLEGIADLLAGVALGWKQLLTISLPVGSYESLLVPVYALILVATVVGLSIATRARFGELAVLAPIAIFVVAIAFGPDYSPWPIEVALGLLAAILLWLVWFRWQRRRASIRSLNAQSRTADVAVESTIDSGFAGARTVVSAVLIIAIAAGASVAATAALPPTADRTVLRTAVVQPFDPRDYVSPLAAYRRYWQNDRVNSVLLTVAGLPEGERLRVATLDAYDGIVYSVGSSEVSSESGSFTRVPYRFNQSAIAGARIEYSVVIDDYRDVWVPSVGKFESATFTGDRAAALRDSFYYNDTGATAAVIAGLQPGDSYTIEAVIPRQPAATDLAQLDPGSAAVPPLDELPAELTTALDDFVAGVDGQGARLVAMLDGLKRDGYISHGIGADEPPSRSGHAADRIAQLFTDPRMIGDAEQYAVTASLMARALGFPSRVVFGFIPDDAGQVRGENASAWIEVNTAQFGWVTIDPNPEVRPIPDEEPQDPAHVARPQTIVPPPVVENEDVDRQTTPESERDDQDSLDPFLALLLGIARVAMWVAIGLAIVLAPFMLIIAAKVRRRRLRRNAPSAVEQISGGWEEFEDSMVDHGLTPPPSSTRSEVAATAGGAQSRVLAAVADRAIFAPEDPDAAEVDAVWKAVSELTSSLDRGVTRWQRIKARISLRSLGGYSVPKLFKR